MLERGRDELQGGVCEEHEWEDAVVPCSVYHAYLAVIDCEDRSCDWG